MNHATIGWRQYNVFPWGFGFDGEKRGLPQTPVVPKFVPLHKSPRRVLVEECSSTFDCVH
jgi:hypothetical protein